jgi:hypothetical protein
MSDIYYFDILSKLVGRGKPIEHDELCCLRLSYDAFIKAIKYMEEIGWVSEIVIDGKTFYRSTQEGNMKVIQMLKERREREEAKRDPNSIAVILDKLDTCWIDLETLKPEDSTELNMTNLNSNFRFVTVLVRDNNGHVGIANRIQQTPCGNQYLDASIETTDWHWSKGDFEPTHWMPFPRRQGR